MSWEINVSLNGWHYFATHERSLTTSIQAITVYDKLCACFPIEQGFKVEMCRKERNNFICDEVHLRSMRKRKEANE